MRNLQRKRYGVKVALTLLLSALALNSGASVEGDLELQAALSRVKANQATLVKDILDLERALQKHGSDSAVTATTYKKLGYLNYIKGAYGDAARWYQMALATPGASPIIRFTAQHELAHSLRESGKKSEAYEAYRKLESMDAPKVAKDKILPASRHWSAILLSEMPGRAKEAGVQFHQVGLSILAEMKAAPTEDAVSRYIDVIRGLDASGAKSDAKELCDAFMKAAPHSEYAILIYFEKLGIESNGKNKLSIKQLESLLLRFPEESPNKEFVRYYLAVANIKADKERVAQKQLIEVIEYAPNGVNQWYDDNLRAAAMRMVMQSHDILGEAKARDAMADQLMKAYPTTDHANYAQAKLTEWHTVARQTKPSALDREPESTLYLGFAAALLTAGLILLRSRLKRSEL